MSIDTEKSPLKGNILIVEDDRLAREFISAMLTKKGYTVRVAGDGELALQSIHTELPELILMDMNMPGMSGIDVCRKIKADPETRNIPVIFLSAMGEVDLKVKALEAGGTDYVTKPVGPSEILARISTHLNMYRLQQRLKIQAEKLAAEIKERKQVEKEKARIEGQYHQAHKMEALGQLAAGLAHEFNNPLAFILSNLDSLIEYTKNMDILIDYYQKLGKTLTLCNQGNLSDNIIKQVHDLAKYEKNMELNYAREDIPELLRDCRDGAGRIEKIVSDFKNFAHPGTGRQLLVDINKCLESTLNIASHELKDKAVITLDLGEIPLVEGYPQKLNQAFLDILVNAAQAIEEKGEIKIQTHKKEGNVIISISDTGCGIEKENLPKIFDPFFTTKDIGKGTGLGLNHTYHIIKEHRGMILAESTVGKGTTFTITLPARSIDTMDKKYFGDTHD